MSIKPKVVNIKKQNYTTFHMRINNGSNEDIEGYISYKVTMPNGEEKIVEYSRTERIMANSEINLYDKFYIEKNAQLGRYWVDGRFFWDNQNILSDTNENDFFDVIEEEI